MKPPYVHLAAALALSLASGFVLAPAPPPALGVAAFGAANAACPRWGDGCVICRRGADGAGKCSTPGIACVARASACEAEAEK